jgi:RNA-directed DNA polymerase
MMKPRASIFGGSWHNDGNAGSRYANVDNWPDNSDDNLGARGRCEDGLGRAFCARRPLRRRRPTTSGHDPWSARLSRFGEHAARSGRAGRSRQEQKVRLSRPAAGFFPPRACAAGQPACARAIGVEWRMGKRHRNLIGKIVAPDNLQEAYRLTARGKRGSRGYLDFKEYDALNLAELAADLREGRYRPGAPSQFYVFDPKRRLISALPFRDRVAQQALCLVIGPIFERALLPRSFACRSGKGTHAGAIALQADLRRLGRRGPVYFLKTDFAAYFASIERGALWRMVEAKISCRATLDLIETIVPRAGIGLPIGALTSQLFANAYAGALDRHLQQTLGEDFWFRYMDDLVVLGETSRHLRAVKESIEDFCRHELALRFSKWQIAPAGRGINFLGYRIWASHKLLRRDSVTRARRKIKALRAAGNIGALNKFVAGWLGHANFADAYNLIRSLELQQQDDTP